MSLAIQTNVSALYAQGALRSNQSKLASTMERLSTGIRVNGAKDDAAGLAIGQNMTSQIRGMEQAIRNVNDGINLVQTAEGGLNSVSNLLQRMRELAVQAANGTYSGVQRAYLQKEAEALREQIDEVVDTTVWNGVNLLGGGFSRPIQVGSDVGVKMDIAIPELPFMLQPQFLNGSFDAGVAGSTSIQGWTASNQRIRLDGTSTVAGWPTPTDPTTAPGGGIESVSGSGTFNTQLSASTSSNTGLSLELSSNLSGVANNPAGVGAVLHGPVVSSNAATSLTTGDTISFDWRAQGGTDAFDVYAYIVDTQTGRTEELLNATGASAADTRPWTTVSHTVAAAGEYRFVFVSGCWDATGGQVAGAKLFIDNVTVATSSGRRSDSGLSDINSASSASIALGTIDTALNAVNSARSTMGSYIDRLLHIADNLGKVSSNAVQSRSTIIDTDYALETTALAKHQIIQQAATAILAQANQQPRAVMALLKNLRS